MSTIRSSIAGPSGLLAFRTPRLRHGRRRSAFGNVLAMLEVWQARAAQRRALRQLEPFQLDDIGVSRAEALREADKPFWRR